MPKKATKQRVIAILVLPCYSQTRGWKAEDIRIYGEILNVADKVVYTSKEYTPDCMYKRNRHLVDHTAEQILEILWDVRRAPSHRQEVKGMARAGWGTFRDHNLYQFIYDLLIRHRDDLQDMYGRLTNCSISTMNRILSGSIDMKYSIFRDFVNAYHLDALQTEILRFCCDETRRMVVFDNYGYTTDQRSAISALSNSILYLSSDDSEAIRLLCERARHRRE